ncbi:MAG TPA: hypothetical protein VGB88_13820 [Alphaproteobacteria bacterium]
MPYVKRGPGGRVAALFAEAQADAREFVRADADEVRRFIGAGGAADDPRRSLTESDFELVRVLEDLISVLLDKNIIQQTDLPQEARAKLLKRRQLRGELDNLVGLVAEEEDI